jgi:LytS/YehU family sensor histidine kinase
VRLGEFLRLALENAGTQEVTLERELEFIRRYLEIEKIRFEDRLQLEYRIAPDTQDACVPNLLLQPLVENAVQHGISRLAAGGRLCIESSVRDGRLSLLVWNDGPAIDVLGRRSDREGVGLANISARLRVLYGDDHTFFIRNRPGGVEAVLEFPLRATERHQQHAYSHR